MSGKESGDIRMRTGVLVMGAHIAKVVKAARAAKRLLYNILVRGWMGVILQSGEGNEGFLSRRRSRR